MKTGQYGVASFRSRQQVISFDQRLRQLGIRTQIVSTPREVAVGCGLSVRFGAGDAGRVLAALAQAPQPNLIGVYLIDPSRTPKLVPLRT